MIRKLRRYTATYHFLGLAVTMAATAIFIHAQTYAYISRAMLHATCILTCGAQLKLINHENEELKDIEVTLLYIKFQVRQILRV